jgi:hypothetical protein
MENDPVLGIFKFSDRGYIDQFAAGFLYMNTLEHFVKQEANSIRRDPNEGTSHMKQARGATLKVEIAGAFESVGTIPGAIRFRRPDDLRTNIFCMYALRASAANARVDERNFGFGDSYAVLRDGDEFLRRVVEAARKSGHEVKYHSVEYVDENSYSGPMGPFRKDSRFSFQSECRIGLFPGTGEPFRLHVGDLSSLVTIGPLNDLNRRIRIMSGSSEQHAG